jgi:translation initiation factor 4A
METNQTNNQQENNQNQPQEEEWDDSLFESNWNDQIEKFEDMGLKKDLLRGIFGYGFETPSVIQQKAITPLTLKRDIIAQAQSGSGKTATFSIGMLQNVDNQDLKTQALILAPTRELATQIHGVVSNLGAFLGIKTILIIGGTEVKRNRMELKEGCHVVVGTPGRVNDLIGKKSLNTDFLKMLIVDEADEMLGLGFLEQINEIIKTIPPLCQIALFSATISPEIIKLTENIMNDPVKILVKKENLTLEGIKQYYVSCQNEEAKYSTLFEVFGNIDLAQCFIYVNTKEKAEKLSETMTESGFQVGCIHGKMEQEDRNNIMRQFREGAVRILISTDLTGRGIDVHQVGLVINFELPNKKESYIHRIGRSGRYGRRGVAINLVSYHELTQMTKIQEFYNTQIVDLPTDLSQIE